MTKLILLSLLALGLVGCNNLSQYDPVMVFVDGDQIHPRKCYMASVHRPAMVYCETWR